jgi:beta-lactam-binding protein with PASTA domain
MDAPAFGLGIDFGTSNTVAMLRWPDGRVKPVLFEGSPLLPSAVFAPADGPLVVGTDALHHGRYHPAQLEPNPKRHIDDTGLLLGERELPVADLLSAVLRHVAAETTRVTGGVFPRTAIAYPAAWGPVRRGALADAAAAAGFGEVMLVPEPTAAADYFTRVLGRDVPVGQALVVYDLGAGTFDASAVRRGDAGFDVVAVDGINDVGGLDLDAALVKWLQEQHGTQRPEVWQALANPTGADEQRQRRMLWDDVRVAKEMLSRAPAVQIRLPALDLDVRITRDEFEDVAGPLLGRTVRTTQGLIRYAQLAPETIAGLLLVGGSSRVPLVATLLHRALGMAPIATEQPELIVAEGALMSVPQAPHAAGPAAGYAPAAPVSPARAPHGAAAMPAGAPLGAAPVSPAAPFSPLAAPAGALAGAAAGAPGSPVAPVSAGVGIGYARTDQRPADAWATVPTAPHPAIRPPHEPVTGTVYVHGQVPAVQATLVQPARGTRPISGPPISGAPISGPPISGPPISGPPISGPPADPYDRRESRVIPIWEVPPAPLPQPMPQPQPTGRTRTTPVQLIAGIIIGLLIVAAGAYFALDLPGRNGRVSVPDLAGKHHDDASIELLDAGLRNGGVVYEASDTVEPERVIRTDPPGNRRVPKGTRVKLVLAKPSDPTKAVTLPDVANRTKDDATAALVAMNLKVGEPGYEESATVAEGSVIRTEPAAGSQVNPTSTVKLILSTGKGGDQGGQTCQVPDVVNKSREDAVNAVQRAGLRTDVRKEDSASVRPGTVIRTDPPAGRHEGNSCRTVTIVVSQGVPFDAPDVVGMTEAQAKSTLESESLVPAVNFRDYCDTTERSALVTAQNPRGGTQVHVGDTVTITVPRYTGICGGGTPSPPARTDAEGDAGVATTP